MLLAAKLLSRTSALLQAKRAGHWQKSYQAVLNEETVAADAPGKLSRLPAGAADPQSSTSNANLGPGQQLMEVHKANSMSGAQQRLNDLLERAKGVLHDVFGFQDFRGVQQAAISAVFEGKDALVLMPTGGGKSLCYALPAAVLQGLVLVVSPLIALMQDQVSGLRSKGLRVDFLSSSRTEAERRSILSGLAAAAKAPVGSAAPAALLQLLYVTPELISKNEGFMDILTRLHAAGRLALLAVDEAHCISSWGHDFRPAYRQLSSLRRRLPGTPMLALTATASQKVRDDVVASLALRSPRMLAMSFNRPNIHYSVQFVDLMAQGATQLGSMGATADDAGVPTLDTAEAAAYLRLLELIRQAGTEEQQARQKQQPLQEQQQEQAQQEQEQRCNTGRFASSSSASHAAAHSTQLNSDSRRLSKQWQAPCAVVYVLKRTTADALASRLARDGVPAAAYHAKLPGAERERVLAQWQAGRVRVVCATTAFGMGIDKADVRLVVHWNLPKTMEGLYQESGRAGRDGQPSRSVVMYSIADRRRMDFILQKEAERSSSRKRKRSNQVSAPTAAINTSSSGRPAAAFSEVVEYCTAAHCRRAFILNHFGEVLQHPDGKGSSSSSSSRGGISTYGISSGCDVLPPESTTHNNNSSSSGGSRGVVGGSCCCDHCADGPAVAAAASQLKELEQEVSMRFAGARQGWSNGRSGARGGGAGGTDDMFGGWGAGSSDEEGSGASDRSCSDDEPDDDAAAAVAAAAAKRNKTGGSFFDAMLAAEQAHERGASGNAGHGVGAVEGLMAKRAVASRDGRAAPAKPKEADPCARALARQRLASILMANPNLQLALAHGAQGTSNSSSASSSMPEAEAASAAVAEAVEKAAYQPCMSALQYRGAATAAAKALQQARSLLEVPGVQEFGASPEALAVVLRGVLAQLSHVVKGGGVAAAGAEAGTTTAGTSAAAAAAAGVMAEGGEAAATAVKLLQGLAGLPVGVQVLEQTGAAKQVRALRKHGDAAVAAAAAATVEAWRGRVAAAAGSKTGKKAR